MFVFIELLCTYMSITKFKPIELKLNKNCFIFYLSYNCIVNIYQISKLYIITSKYLIESVWHGYLYYKQCDAMCMS